MRAGGPGVAVVVWSLVALVMLGVTDQGSVVASEAAASTSDGSPCRPATDASSVGGLPEVPEDRADDATLRSLHAGLAHLDGFRDVHLMLQGPPRFVAWFDADATLPTDLPELEAPYPVTAKRLDVSPSAAEGTAAGVADPPLVPSPCGNQRPGGALGACTMSWQLTDAVGALYVATAGHCIPWVGWTFSFGTAVYKRADGVGADFGLIRVDDVVAPGFDAAMCHWGGPVATATDTDAGFGDVVRMYGHGVGFGALDATRPRSGVLHSYGVESFTYVGPVMQGDSGAPVMLADGGALGVHTHGLNGVGGVGLPVTTPTLKWGTRMDAGIQMAEAELGIDLTLRLAPLA